MTPTPYTEATLLQQTTAKSLDLEFVTGSRCPPIITRSSGMNATLGNHMQGKGRHEYRRPAQR